MAEVMPMVQNLLRGVNGCLLALGPSGGGKSMCLNGKPQSTRRGVLSRTVEKILHSTTPFIGVTDVRQFDKRQTSAIMASESDFKHNEPERAFLRVSVYLIFQDCIYDLLSSPTQQSLSQRGIRVDSFIDKETYDVLTKVTGLCERLIVNMASFTHLMEEV